MTHRDRGGGSTVLIRDGRFYWALLAIAVPTAVQGFISLGVNMLDNIMVGSLGDVTLAAVSLANQVTLLLNGFTRGVAGGAAVLISQYWGKDDRIRIKQVMSAALQICVGVNLLCAAGIVLFPEQVMHIFSSDPSAVQEGAGYIRILAVSYVFSSVSETMIAMLRCVEAARLGMMTSGMTLFTNLILNYALIFGKFGLPRLGAPGAALATDISRALEMGVVLFYVFVVDKRLRLRWLELWSAGREMFRDYFRFGTPVLLGDFQWALVGFVKNALLGHMGVLMVAANSIAETVFSLFYVFITGLSNGACVLVGKSVGAGDHVEARKRSNTIQILFAAVGLLVCASVYSVRYLAPSFYQVSAQAKALASQFIALNAWISIGTCYHAACFTGINRGAGDGRFVMQVDLLCGWLVVIPAVWLSGFVLKAPLPVVYVCTRIDQCFKWIIALIRLRGDKWIHNVTRLE